MSSQINSLGWKGFASGPRLGGRGSRSSSVRRSRAGGPGLRGTDSTEASRAGPAAKGSWGQFGAVRVSSPRVPPLAPPSQPELEATTGSKSGLGGGS